MMNTTITTNRDGWIVVTLPSGMEIMVPCDDRGDDRIEVRCNGFRVWVESHDDGPLVSQIEKFS